MDKESICRAARKIAAFHKQEADIALLYYKVCKRDSMPYAEDYAKLYREHTDAESRYETLAIAGRFFNLNTPARFVNRN